jgi:hypothetical protein
MTDKEVVSLKEYIDWRFSEHEKLDEANRKAIADALLKSSLEMERRLLTMNEFREQINRERNTYVTRENFDLRFKPIETNNSYRQGNTAGKEWVIGYILAGIAIITSVVAILN